MTYGQYEFLIPAHDHIRAPAQRPELARDAFPCLPARGSRQGSAPALPIPFVRVAATMSVSEGDVMVKNRDASLCGVGELGIT
jgi:hypothetical protein